MRSAQVTGLNCEAPISQPLHALFVARSGVDLPLKLYKAKAAAGQRFKVPSCFSICMLRSESDQ